MYTYLTNNKHIKVRLLPYQKSLPYNSTKKPDEKIVGFWEEDGARTHDP